MELNIAINGLELEVERSELLEPLEILLAELDVGGVVDQSLDHLPLLPQGVLVVQHLGRDQNLSHEVLNPDHHLLQLANVLTVIHLHLNASRLHALLNDHSVLRLTILDQLHDLRLYRATLHSEYAHFHLLNQLSLH